MSRARTGLWASSEGIRFRLMVTVVAAAALPLIAVVVILGRWTYETIDDQSLALQQETAARFESEIRSSIAHVETQLAVLDAVLGLGELDPAPQRAALENMLASDRAYQELVLIDFETGGVIRVSRSGRTAVDTVLAPGVSETAASVMDTMTVQYGPVAFDETLREPLTTVAVPLLNRRTGVVDSVVVATLRFKEILDLLGLLVTPDAGDVYVVDPRGVVVAHSNPAVVLSGTAIELPESDGAAIGLSGADAVLAMKTIQIGDGRLTVVAEQPSSTASRVADRALEVVVIVTILAVFVAVMVVALAARRLVRPIEALAESADRIAAGDLSHRVGERGKGEIGELARSFNAMADRVADVIGALEARVSERTHELELAAEEQHRLIGELETQAAHDFLTGLPNRYSLEQRLDLALNSPDRQESFVLLILLDLDNFKEVNDTFGHAVGDQLLVAVARRLEQVAGDAHLIARLGGDEFAVVQSDPADPAAIAQRLLTAFEESFDVGSHEIFSHATLGISLSEGTVASPTELMRRADFALYRAKNEGGNTFAVFEEAMDIDIERRASLAHDLPGAIGRDELFLEYQPQVRLDDGRVVAVEALVRWRHPVKGVIWPEELLRIADGAGLIDEIGEWVLLAACTQARSWSDHTSSHVVMSVNVSAGQVRDVGLVSNVSRVLSATGLAPEMLQIELSERALSATGAHAATALEAVHDLGVGLALDDFGGGEAALVYPGRHPFATLKIDPSLVKMMASDAASDAIVVAVIDMAAKLDMHVVAKGVETAEQLAQLGRAGCDAAQGFFVGRPIPGDELATMLAIEGQLIGDRDAVR